MTELDRLKAILTRMSAELRAVRAGQRARLRALVEEALGEQDWPDERPCG